MPETTPAPRCLNCGHDADRHDLGCYTHPDGTRAAEMSRFTCLCGYYEPAPNEDDDPVVPDPFDPEAPDLPPAEESELDA